MIFRKSSRPHRRRTWILLPIIVVPTLGGCSSSNPQSSLLRVDAMVFLDRTASGARRNDQLVRIATQVASGTSRSVNVEACAFGSAVHVAPFYSGHIQSPAKFHTAVQTALAPPLKGQGTYGAPLLLRVRRQIHLHHRPTLAVFITDGGFDDLAKIQKEAAILAREPEFLRLYVLPVVSDGDAYTKLEAALRPLGNRVRLAATADAPIAVREIQAALRSSTKGGK